MDIGDQRLVNDCNVSFTKNEMNNIIVTMVSTCLLSTMMCIIAILFVMCLRLYKYFVYRLALYQVLACLLLSLAEALQIMNINYTENKFHIDACIATAFLMEYTIWLKLLFTLFLVFHLFCLAVCLKNCIKLELVYFLISVAFPVLPACIPFSHNLYGIAGAWCWIQIHDSYCPDEKYTEGVIEQFTLWYGPLFVSLTVCLLAVIVIAVVLCRRAYLSHKKESKPLIKENPNKTALKELLPLLAYPIIFYLLSLFPLANRLHGAISPVGSYHLITLYIAMISEALWGFFSSLALLIHVLLLRKLHFQQGNMQTNKNERECDTVIYTKHTTASTAAISHFTIPRESEYEEIVDDKC